MPTFLICVYLRFSYYFVILCKTPNPKMKTEEEEETEDEIDSFSLYGPTDRSRIKKRVMWLKLINMRLLLSISCDI